MTKLDEAIEKYKEEGETCMAFQVPEIFNAAQQYAALLKLAPEIGKLVEAGFIDQHEPQTVYGGAFTKGEIGFVPHNSTSRYAGWLFWKHPDGLWITLGQIPEAANTRPTLKAIHDNLTKWED